MSSRSPLVALVLCGGGGTRLWPISSDARPKQFLRLLGEKTLFQSTWQRLEAAGVDETVVLTNTALEGLARADLAEIGVHDARFVLEPSRRDSGPAIAAGMAAIRNRLGDDAIVLVAASDHLVPDPIAFAATVSHARTLAARDYLVTFGIKPTFPATEYGYIQRGAPVEGLDGAFAVAKFHEKPPHERAKAYSADPAFAWNAGIFMFRAGHFAREAATHMPDIWAQANAAITRGRMEGLNLMLDAEAFGACRRISIDFALMERSSRVGTVPAGFDWSDIGSWSAVYEALPADADGVSRHGPVATRECKDTLVFAEGIPICAIGLEDFVVVASPRGVFVAPRARAQEIKALLDSLPAL